MTLTESANEVLPGLWVGDANACAAAAGARFNRLCVLEDPCGVAGCEHQRILSLQDGGALPDLLDAAANIIDKRWAGLNPPLLVHCGAGVERSPLTVAWWMRRRFGFDFDRGYAWLQSRRPCVADRRLCIRGGSDWGV